MTVFPRACLTVQRLALAFTQESEVRRQKKGQLKENYLIRKVDEVRQVVYVDGTRLGAHRTPS